MVAVSSLAEWGGGPLLLWRLRVIGAGGRREVSLRESRARYRSLYQRMRTHRQQARDLTAALIRAREEEAKRIAHQLHDEAGQITSAFCLRLQELEEQMPSQHRRRLRGLRTLVLGFEDRLRGLSHELRPTILDDLGLAPAVGFLAKAFSSRTGLAVEVRGNLGSPRFDPPIETALYRVLQEAFANVARHARARRVVVDFRRRDEALRCSITDDGAGFAAGPGTRGEGGLGLLGIRERLDALGGRLLVRSAPGHGTTLIVTVSPGKRPCPAGS
jgi:signal transduction histidine kinase